MRNVLKFWFIVIRRFFKTSVRVFSLRGQIIEGLLRWAAFLLVSWLGTRGVLNLIVVGQFSGDFQKYLRYGLVIIIALAVMFFFNLIYQPAKIYEEMGGFLSNPIILTAEPQKPRTNVETWAYLNVHNSSSHRVTNCTLTLIKAIDTNSLENVLRTSERLTWSGRDQKQPDEPGDEPKTIIGKGWRICDVAQTQADLNRSIFTLWFNNNQVVPPGTYELEIEINGEWIIEDKTVGFAEAESFLLEYTGGFDLSIKNIE